MDDAALMECLTTLRAGEAVESLVFARGRRPQNGPDGRLALQFSPNLKPGVEREDGSMDFRSRDFGASMVDKDSVIATLLPPELGRVGSDVTGASLTADDGSTLVVTAGEGVRTSDDGETFYAELDGRGTLKNGVLTCHWHQARFDAYSGCAFDVWADDIPGHEACEADGWRPGDRRMRSRTSLSG